MELDDDIFPSQLEQLLPELQEDDPFENDVRYDSFLANLIGADTDAYQESLPFHIRHLLDALPEDDPLRDNARSKPHLPNLKGKIYGHLERTTYPYLIKINNGQVHLS